MSTNFLIVLEPEESGVFSAYVPGLPVYAQGDTRSTAVAAIRRTLAAYLDAHPDAISGAEVKVADVRTVARAKRREISVRGPAALVGSRTSLRKATASRENGRLGGRPRLKP